MSRRDEHTTVRHWNTSKKHDHVISEHMSEFYSSTKDVVEIEVQLNSLFKDTEGKKEWGNFKPSFVHSVNDT